MTADGSTLRYSAFALLFAATLVALASVGGLGVYGAPVLLMLQFLAARNSPEVTWRVLWTLAAGATAAEGVWGLAYITLGETHPGIWVWPTLAALAAAVLTYSFTKS